MSHNTITNEPHTAPIERRLNEQLARSERQLVELESVITDPDTIQEDRDGTRRVIDSIREDVRQIQRALARVADGTYGRCVSCGDPIPIERLETIPFVSHCTRCA